jgi:hypothetical protein
MSIFSLAHKNEKMYLNDSNAGKRNIRERWFYEKMMIFELTSEPVFGVCIALINYSDY